MQTEHLFEELIQLREEVRFVKRKQDLSFQLVEELVKMNESSQNVIKTTLHKMKGCSKITVLILEAQRDQIDDSEINKASKIVEMEEELTRKDMKISDLVHTKDTLHEERSRAFSEVQSVKQQLQKVLESFSVM